MPDSKYEINDLITSTLNQSPLEFEKAFGDLIVDRLQTAIHDKKVQFAQQMYSYDESEDQNSEEE